MVWCVLQTILGEVCLLKQIPKEEAKKLKGLLEYIRLERRLGTLLESSVAEIDPFELQDLVDRQPCKNLGLRYCSLVAQCSAIRDTVAATPPAPRHNFMIYTVQS